MGFDINTRFNQQLSNLGTNILKITTLKSEKGNQLDLKKIRLTKYYTVLKIIFQDKSPYENLKNLILSSLLKTF